MLTQNMDRGTTTQEADAPAAQRAPRTTRGRARRILRVRTASALATLTILLTGGVVLAPHGMPHAHATINHCSATPSYHAHRNAIGLVNQHHYFQYMTRRYVGSYLQSV